MIEENSGQAKSVPLSEVSHLVSVPFSEVLLYIYMDAVFDLFCVLILLIQYVWIHVNTWYQPL